MYRLMSMLTLAATLLASCTGGNRSQNRSEDASISEADSVIIDHNGKLFLAVGTYTSEEGSKGIYLYNFDCNSGASDSLSMVEVSNPSYLAFSPDERFLYSVGELDGDQGAVHAFSFDKESGSLQKLNSQKTNGSGPCYITIDPKGKNVHTANYGGGSISSFQVNDDGSLSPMVSQVTFTGSGLDSSRQEQPHLHSVRYSPDGRSLFAADLGSDRLYRFDVLDSPFQGQPVIQESSMSVIETPPGNGPRHFDFHPDGGKYLYLLGELSGEVVVYECSGRSLIKSQVIKSDTVGARGSADIHISPDGRFLYASNRLKADGIAIFSIDSDDGTLQKVGYQTTAKHPRNFVITPNGKFLLVAGRDDNMIQVFSIDASSGMLTNTNQDILVSKPVCLKFAGQR